MEEQIKEYLKKRPKIRNKEHLIQMFSKEPHCIYCKKETKWYQEIRSRNLKKGERYPDDMATLEHLASRLNPYKRYATSFEQNRALACFKCNFSRGVNDWESVPPEEKIRLQNLFTKRPKGMARALWASKNSALISVYE